jgi:hypothetical protein
MVGGALNGYPMFAQDVSIAARESNWRTAGLIAIPTAGLLGIGYIMSKVKSFFGRIAIGALGILGIGGLMRGGSAVLGYTPEQRQAFASKQKAQEDAAAEKKHQEVQKNAQAAKKANEQLNNPQ